MLDDGELSVSNGVNQGYVLAPTLFSMVFSAMLLDAFNKEDPGINVKYIPYRWEAL